MLENSKKIRKILDEQGLEYVKIFASGDLDEFKVAQLLEGGAKIDAFGVGTKMGTSADRPYLDIIYKLCETKTTNGDFSPIMKLSKDKITLPGRKQVYRFTERDGTFKKDVIALADEKVDGKPLLVKVIEKGKLTYKLPSLTQIRETATESLSKLPENYKALMDASVYPVELSGKLQNLIEALKQQLTTNEVNFHKH
jgi:nicotinate phosphoribosyltransferase